MNKPSLFTVVVSLTSSLILIFYISTKEKEIELSDLEKAWSGKLHSYAELSQGRTHYEFSNQKQNFLVVLIHGVSGPMTAWDKTVPFLNKNNISTLRFDLYGRGFSNRTQQKQNLALYINQLKELLTYIKNDKPLIIIGSSFGAVIASEYTAKVGKNILGLVLIGPAGSPIQVPFMAKFRDIPILGNLLFNLTGKKIIVEQNHKYFVNEKIWDSQKDYFTDQLSIKGSDQAILSTMRNSPVQSYLGGYEQLGKSSVPVTTLWGKQDATFPYDNYKLLRKRIPQMQLYPINNSGHLPQFESEKIVNPILLEIIKQLHPI